MDGGRGRRSGSLMPGSQKSDRSQDACCWMSDKEATRYSRLVVEGAIKGVVICLQGLWKTGVLFGESKKGICLPH